MSNPHPFYRFSPAWNTGFYPQNQVASNQLNDIYVELLSWLPSNVAGKTISQFYSDVRALIKPYNEFPVFGNFTTTIFKIPDTPNWEYNINIQDVDLSVIDSTQVVTINGTFDPTTQIVNTGTANLFNVGTYSGTFGKSNIPVDQEVVNTLNIVNQYGSAIFPLTYKYDSSVGIATSGLARGNVYQLSDSGAISTIPATTLPSLNARRFTLPALTAEDKFAITFMERVINASIGQTDDVALSFEYNSIAMPDGMTKTFVLDSGTYDRIQINVTSANDRVFAMIGRLDGTWLWQRFVNDIGDDDNNDFLTNYSESTSLPYEPTSGSRYIYFDTWYDFDFCDFTPDCYVSPEFYPMPSIPGDIYQFNVPTDSGNLTGITSVNVGLFEQDGGFVQKIGTGQMVQSSCEIEFALNLTTPGSWDFYRNNINSQISEAPGDPVYTYNWQLFDESNIVVTTLGSVPLVYEFTPYTDETLIAYLESIGISVIIIGDDYFLRYTQSNLCCGKSYTLKSFIVREPVEANLSLLQSSVEECSCILGDNAEGDILTQCYATCTIPAVKDGCYRLGLYNEPQTSCDMTFEYTLSGDDLTNYLDSVNAAFSSLNPFISWIVVTGDTYVYNVTSDSTTALDIANFCNVYIPGMTVTLGEGFMTFVWERNDLPCNDIYAMANCLSDLDATNCFDQLWVSETQNCICGNSYYLYSLSNIINIDRSDCFSTILEFWSDDNTIAQGFEYFNGWKQRVRIGLNGGGEKPVIEESLYRQSNGVHKRPQNKQDLSIDLHTDFFDLETQLAMTDATRHPYLVWNNQGIFVKGDIDVATIQDFTTQTSFETLSQMKFQALKQGFQPRNSSCLTC